MRSAPLGIFIIVFFRVCLRPVRFGLVDIVLLRSRLSFLANVQHNHKPRRTHAHPAAAPPPRFLVAPLLPPSARPWGPERRLYFYLYIQSGRPPPPSLTAARIGLSFMVGWVFWTSDLQSGAARATACCRRPALPLYQKGKAAGRKYVRTRRGPIHPIPSALRTTDDAPAPSA